MKRIVFIGSVKFSERALKKLIKLGARIYKSELKKHPFPRSIETIKALATMRGSQAGCKYAEGFITLRNVW